MRRNRQAGQALYVAAASLVVLMGFLGLGIDLGVLRYEKRLQQTAADAAAIAGANNLAYGGVTVGAQNASAANGFANTAGDVTNCGASAAIGTVCVQVNNPPASGPHGCDGGTCDSGYVEVLVAAVQPTYFMKVFGVTKETVMARAVATNLSGPGSGCLYTLGTSGDGILMNGTNETINGTACGIVDDADLLENGSSDSITAASIGVSGSKTLNGSVTASPPPVTGIPAAADPLAYLNSSAPSPASCTGSRTTLIITTSRNVSGGDYCGGITINGTNNTVTIGQGVFGPVTINGSGNNVTLSPGTYSSIIFNGASGSISFNSGLYVISGSPGFVDNGSNLAISGTGLTFYATGPAAITLNGSNFTANLTAPTSGADTGMLFWQAPSDTSTMVLNGNGGSVSYDGVVYAPSAQVTINGQNNAKAYLLVVVKNLLMNGSSTLNLTDDTSGLTGGSPIKNAILVE